MANRWNPTTGQWEDDATGNVLVGGTPGPNGTWAGGTWRNPAGASFINGAWSTPYQAQSGVFNAQQGSINAQRNTNAAQQATMPFQQATLQAERNVLPFSQASLNAQGGVLQARQGTLGAKQGTINAQGGIIAATGAQNQGKRTLTVQEQAEVVRQKGEYQAQLLAQNNPQDQAAVATAKRYRAATDTRNRTLGITPAQEIDVPLGFNNPLPPGVRAKLTTQGEDVARANAESQKLRGFDMDSARLAVQLLGSDVDQARLVAAQAGMTLDQAQLAVDAAENQAGFASLAEKQAGLGVDRAKLDEAGANLDVTRAKYGEDTARLDETQATYNARLADRAPFEGAERYTDPYTGTQSWMTPAEKDRRAFDYSQEQGFERIPQQYNLNQGREQYKTSADARGDPLPGFQAADYINFLTGVGPGGFSSSVFTTRTPQQKNEQVFASLLAKYRRQGYPNAEALALSDLQQYVRSAAVLREGRKTTTPPSTGEAPPPTGP